MQGCQDCQQRHNSVEPRPLFRSWALPGTSLTLRRAFGGRYPIERATKATGLSRTSCALMSKRTGPCGSASGPSRARSARSWLTSTTRSWNRRRTDPHVWDRDAVRGRCAQSGAESSGGWEQRHRVRGNVRINGGDRHPVLERLGDEDPVEWVAVQRRECGQVGHCPLVHRQAGNPVGVTLCGR